MPHRPEVYEDLLLLLARTVVRRRSPLITAVADDGDFRGCSLTGRTAGARGVSPPPGVRASTAATVSTAPSSR